MKFSKEYLQERINSIYGSNVFTVISECNKSTDYVSVRHEKCGNEFSIIANELTKKRNIERNKKTCPKCRDKKLTQKELQETLDELTEGRLTILKMGTNTHAHDTTIKCNKCNHERNVSLHSLIANLKNVKGEKIGCPVCSNKNKKTTDIFIKEVFDAVGEDYTVTGNYVNSDQPIDIHCNLCNTDYSVRRLDFLSGDRCPGCNNLQNTSKGWNIVNSYLIKNEFEFSIEARFSDCKNSYTLPFDFKVMLSENTFVLIEYDGIQHLKGWGNKKESLEKIQKNDTIKNKYCLENNIPLLRIPHDKNEEEIIELLKDFIDKYK